MQNHISITTPLHHYIEVDPDYYDAYELYTPDTETLAQLRSLLPAAHIITPSRYSCSDCARNIPQMTRIAEHLPGWTWEIFDSDSNEERKARLGITCIPTFIVYDPDGREIGRIEENPATGSLEHDLLIIARRYAERQSPAG